MLLFTATYPLEGREPTEIQLICIEVPYFILKYIFYLLTFGIILILKETMKNSNRNHFGKEQVK